MAKSIADQLLNLGLADKKQVQKEKSQKRKQEKLSRKHKLTDHEDSKAAAERALKEKAERDRKINLERQKAADEKALLAQVKQIVQTTKIESPDGDVKFSFADRQDNKIKAIYVTATIQDDLAKGKLAIATADGQFYVVTKQVAEKIIERSQTSIVFLADPKNESVDEDDPYKDFVIPDDLMW